MTNEEKARECARGWCGDVYDCAEEAAIEMADWKDQQFKEYLEGKKAEADIKMGDAYENGDEWGYYIAEQNKQLFDEIINELFKED